MDRTELNTVFWQTVSLWINDAENNTYAIDPANYCVIGYDIDSNTIITEWLYTQVTEPTINDLLAYELNDVNLYWDKIVIIPQSMNEYSNIYSFSNGITKSDIPVSLLNNGNMCIDNDNMYVLINGTWKQATLT